MAILNDLREKPIGKKLGKVKDLSMSNKLEKELNLRKRFE
jgi:hypothetical protein